jgi:excisionase family DNA binding protein
MTEITFEKLPKAVSEIFDKLDNIEKLLNIQNQPQLVDELLTIQQAGEFIKLTVPTIYSLVSRNNIPFSKKGKRLYFSKSDLSNWIKEGRNKTISELGKEAHSYLKKS